MELMEAIKARRSIRKYTNEPVSRELLEELLEAACWAPSADNRQPWHFVVLTKPEDIARLKETMGPVSEKTNLHLQELFPRNPEVVQEVTHFLRHLGDAPIYILVFSRKTKILSRDSLVLSVAAAIQNMLLVAHEKGLGACWISAINGTGFGPLVQQEFAPEHDELLSLITLGYPAQSPKPPARKENRWEIR